MPSTKLYPHSDQQTDAEFRNLYKNFQLVTQESRPGMDGVPGLPGSEGDPGEAGEAGLPSNTEVLTKVVTSPSIYWAPEAVGVSDAEIASWFYNTGEVVSNPFGANLDLEIWEWRNAGSTSVKTVWGQFPELNIYVGSESPADIYEEFIARKFIIPAGQLIDTQRRGHRPVPIARFDNPVIIHRVYFHQRSLFNADNNGPFAAFNNGAWWPEGDGDFKLYLTDLTRPYPYFEPDTQAQNRVSGPSWWAGDLQSSMFSSFSGTRPDWYDSSVYPKGICLNRHGIRRGHSLDLGNPNRYYWGDNQIWRADQTATQSRTTARWRDPVSAEQFDAGAVFEPRWSFDHRGPVVTSGETSLWLDGAWGFTPQYSGVYWGGAAWETHFLLDIGFNPYALFELVITIFYEEL